MNVPVPPVFVYETEFNQYQVMDGLQRITAVIDFYNDKYELEGLLEWSELNGRKYSQLPQKIKEGIDPVSYTHLDTQLFTCRIFRH